MLGFLKKHWKTIAVAAIATVAFVAVTAATGGLAAPLLATIGATALTTPLALATGGFASGVAGYLANQWLNRKRATVKDALKSGAISGVVTLATAGLFRFVAPALTPLGNRVVPAAIRALPNPVKVTVANSLAGSALGAGTQATVNVATGRPIGENVKEAAAIGGLNGALLVPAQRFIGTPVLRETRGLVGALDGAAALGRVNPLADARTYLEQSPSLAKGLDYLVRRGWEVRYGPPGEGTFTSRGDRVIQIASDHPTPEDVAQAIAHELGHALDARPKPFFASSSEMGRFQLEGEGKAALFNARVRNEILANTGVDIGVNGDAVGPVSAIANDPSLSDADKIARIADIFAKAHPSGTGAHMTYEYYYGVRNATVEKIGAFWKGLFGSH